MPRLFIALDTPELDAAVLMAKSLAEVPRTGLKLGLEFFGAAGPAGVAAVRTAAPCAALFLDLKFHDIPNTVVGVIRSVVPP